MKKILIYNWIAFDEREHKGGGVTVYTKNLVEQLIRQGEYEVYFLSSGRAYDDSGRIYVEQTHNIFGSACRSFQIVNSPVVSSAHVAFPNPEKYLNDRKLLPVLRHFFEEQGGFHIVHYQNFEGLSLDVFRLKEFYPNTKFLYSVHNYFLFCPQVMLWRNDSEICHCKCGECCVGCMPKDVLYEKVIANQKLNTWKMRNSEKKPPDEMIQEAESLERQCTGMDKRKIGAAETQRLGNDFFEFYEKNMEYGNRYIDNFLAVSQRVKEIAVQKGIAPSKISVEYIGTKVAEDARNFCKHEKKLRVGDPITICYLGYARKAKGFFFLLDALDRLDSVTASKLNVILATKISEDEIMTQVNGLREKVRNVKIYQGYQHDMLAQILKNVDIGIVPVLWEDNLPQVAIEMVSYGVPILCSSLGGAGELTAVNGFTFEGGNLEDFVTKLQYFVLHPEKIQEYWNDCQKPLTVEEHIGNLRKYYEG